jgi:iron complex outermembrane receptor protein
LGVVFLTYAQDCNLTLEGYVIDKESNEPLPYVSIYVQEISDGTITDSQGKFSFSDLCPGEYHINLSHIGCESENLHIDIKRDTLLRIHLSHSPTDLGAVVIEGKKSALINQSSSLVKRQTIEENTNKNLSGLIENESGVHLIKNGSGISKPVIHGLYGNRLAILNNGIVQSGQQWGNDHSPEIDPYTAERIVVVKGVNAIEYGQGNLGSLVLIEPNRIEREPHLHGQINYNFESNGRGHNLNTRLQKYTPSLSWRINGSLKKYGDRSTPDYYLRNTGTEELNFSLQLEKNLKDNVFVDFYASTFNTTLGILRGAHIGNITDLELAFAAETPYFTEEDFTYSLNAPKQEVNHHLVKTKMKYLISDQQSLELVIAGQVNDRKEFDVRRSGRSDIPALSLRQYTLDGEIKYTQDLKNNWLVKVGNQNRITDNTNDPETGILPLIPDYLSFRTSAFTTLGKEWENTVFNLGLRYDYEFQSVATISRGIHKEIVRYNNKFHNTSALIGLRYKLSTTQDLSWNTGYAMRNPGVNELYSNGLHQGVSGIEEGDPDLKTEKAIKTTLEYKWIPNANFSFKALAYIQQFEDFIYLQPEDELRLTIRGAFPVFRYNQTNSRIHGFDLSGNFTLAGNLFGSFNYSYLKGWDLSNDTPLVFMPPNSASGSLTYRTKGSIRLTDKIRLDNIELEGVIRSVFEQTNILDEQDFVPPPPGYTLLHAKISSNIILPGHKLRWFIKVNNVMNLRYRDYLNRQRYFADEEGRSFIVGINYKF